MSHHPLTLCSCLWVSDVKTAFHINYICPCANFTLILYCGNPLDSRGMLKQNLSSVCFYVLRETTKCLTRVRWLSTTSHPSDTQTVTNCGWVLTSSNNSSFNKQHGEKNTSGKYSGLLKYTYV